MLSEGGFRSGSSNEAMIYRLGPNVKVHRRHMLQQSEYTMAILFKPELGASFAQHGAVFGVGEVMYDIPWNFQLTKFNIPTRERNKVLRLLDEHNLNGFSLFGSEESLMETLAFRKLDLSAQGPRPV
jgi:hypothetical protein